MLGQPHPPPETFELPVNFRIYSDFEIFDATK